MPKALVLTGHGINCDLETEYSLKKSRFSVKRSHISDIRDKKVRLDAFDLLAIPGGFSFGDDIGAGRVLANTLKFGLRKNIEDFISQDGLVIGICNGFQALVKMGILPDTKWNQSVTLTHNASGKFEDRWVYLKSYNNSAFTQDIDELYLPVRHGEGRFICSNEELDKLEKNNHVVFRYTNPNGPTRYPWNPNGSVNDIAGICDASGHVLGMMPHPEAYNDITNHPRWYRGESHSLGTDIFKSAYSHIKN